jgi:flagellar protein FlaG
MAKRPCWRELHGKLGTTESAAHFLRRWQTRYTGILMANPTQPNVKLTNTSEYRENYANSVQIRVNVWDFFLVFGTLLQQSETQVEIQNFQGIYLSPQQAKALLGILQQNVGGYESAFGEIKLDPRMMPGGPVH